MYRLATSMGFDSCRPAKCARSADIIDDELLAVVFDIGDHRHVDPAITDANERVGAVPHEILVLESVFPDSKLLLMCAGCPAPA
jgi:hypothetical protein